MAAYDYLMDVDFTEVTHMGSLNPPKLSAVYWHGNQQPNQSNQPPVLMHVHRSSVSFSGWHRAHCLILVFVCFFSSKLFRLFEWSVLCMVVIFSQVTTLKA